MRAGLIPLLSKEGSLRRRRRRGWSVQRPAQRLLIDAREALLINLYCSSLNRPPQPSLREGIPALLRRGISDQFAATFGCGRRPRGASCGSFPLYFLSPPLDALPASGFAGTTCTSCR